MTGVELDTDADSPGRLHETRSPCAPAPLSWFSIVPTDHQRLTNPAPAEEGLIVQEILDAMYASAARDGGPISIGGER